MIVSGVYLVEVRIATLKVFELGHNGGTKSALKLVLIEIKFLKVAVLIAKWLCAFRA